MAATGSPAPAAWNDVVMPNTLPRTANEPSATTAAPPAARASAPTSWTTPVRSRSPSKREHVTTHDVDDGHRDGRLDEVAQPLAAADDDDAGEPAEEDVGRELDAARDRARDAAPGSQ